MLRRLGLVPLTCALALAMAGEGFAQVRVRTEAIKPSAQSPAQPSPPQTGTTAPNSDAAAKKRTGAAITGPPPEIILDASRLPEPVARTRDKILAAARSGDLNKLAAVMQASGQMPIFSLNDDKDPIPFWKANYPDSDGVEILSIIIEILEAGFVHADQGTPQDSYVWPYFARMPLNAISAAQKVELFKIVTGADYKDMLDFGAYNFYRLGIAPDGTWQFFVAGD